MIMSLSHICLRSFLTHYNSFLNYSFLLFISAIVLRPSGLQQQVPVKINDDETITITYDPVEHGMHELRINVHSPVKSGSPDSTISMPLQGSPYKFYVDITGTGRITAYGPGLSHGITSQLAEFTIVTKEAGVGKYLCWLDVTFITYFLISLIHQI